MNILIPHEWLLEHLDSDISTHEFKERLSLCGPSVERIEEIEGEPVYDIETTTNRVDATSVRGIAREAAAILPEFDIKAKLKPLKLDELEARVATLPELDLKVENDPELCSRITCVLIDNVKLGDSPAWLQKRLKQVGQRPLNNAIDITNYVMWEIGHPCHAFDYDRITSKKIVVREAKKGETFTTLDNKTFKTLGGEVVFDDGSGTIVDLPGIMGTANTVVTNETTRVLLWIESVDAKKIRFASMSHAIRSQAAVLNEKHVDPTLGREAILRGLQLFEDVTGGTAASQIYDDFPEPVQPQTVTLKQSRLTDYMGLTPKQSQVEAILKHLDFAITTKGIGDELTYTVTPPTFRADDVQIEQDVIEEIARIYGYHNLPSVVMDTPIPDHPDHHDFGMEYQIKQWLAGWGAQEIYTYSMVSADIAKQSGHTLDEHLALKNPLNDDLVYMRRSLIPSLLDVYVSNPGYKTTVFEMQNVYHPHKGKGVELPAEVMSLTMMTSETYAALKGMLDALMAKLYVADYRVEADAHGDVLGKVMIGKQQVGSVSRMVRGDATYWAVEMQFYAILEHAATHPSEIGVISVPPVIEDLTFTMPEKTALGPVIEAMVTMDEMIENVMLKDTYEQNATFTVHYRDPEQPLSDEQVAPVRKALVTLLKTKHGGELVGSLD